MPDERRASPLDAFRASSGASKSEPDAADEFGDDLDEFDEADVDPAFYANGGISLSESEIEALGELRGRRVLVLGAGNGEDVASLVNLGGDVTVIDDEESLVGVRDLAAAAHLSPTLVIDDLVSVSVANRTQDFDIVYSGFATLDWVSDLDAWAGGITDCLRRGGRLVIYDEHPFAPMVAADAGRLVLVRPYFGVYEEDEDTGGEGDGDDGAQEADAAPDDNGPAWTLGDVISALGANGLATISLAEFPESDRFVTALDRIVSPDVDELGWVPAAFLLVALKL